jgi:PAS domain-containing protein
MSTATELAQLALLGEAIECADGVAVFVWDDDRNYVAVNQAACALIGRTRTEILSMRVGDMTADRGAPYFADVQHGPQRSGRLTVDRDDGPLEIEWVTTQTRIAGLPYMVSMCWRADASS